MDTAKIKAMLRKNYESIMQKDREAVEEAARNTNKLMAPILAQALTEWFYEAIAHFYASYSPVKYHRHYSMYRLLEISQDGDMTQAGYYQDRMSQFERSSGGDDENTLYNSTFRWGFHGGAWSTRPGIPRYRAGYHYSVWGSIAKYSKPPLEIINERAEDYRNNKIAPLFWAIFNPELAKSRAARGLKG